MRILLLLIFCITSACGVVLDDDIRIHPVLKQIVEMRGADPIRMNKTAMHVFAEAINVVCKDGFEVAAVQFSNNKQSVIINSDVPDDVPLTLIESNNFAVAIYQKDQKKPLADIEEYLDAGSIHNKTNEEDPADAFIDARMTGINRYWEVK